MSEQTTSADDLFAIARQLFEMKRHETSCIVAGLARVLDKLENLDNRLDKLEFYLDKK